MLSNRTIELVRMQVNIKDVVSDYATLHPSSSNFKCCCPLHHEKTPSLHINPARNTWHCFGYGEGGDAIAFILKKENMDFPEAVRYLASKHHISIEEDTHERTPEEQEQDKQREAIFTAYSLIQKYYIANIHNQDVQARAAYTYALNCWGKDFVEEFGIGFAYNAWDGLINYAKQQLLSSEILTRLGLIAHSEIVDKVAFLLGRLEREYEVDRYTNLLHDVIQGKSMWRKAIHAAQQNHREESLRCNDQNSHYLDLFEK